MDLPLGEDFVRLLAEHRHLYLTSFFQLFTFFGEIEGYVLLVALVYAVFDKALAFRLGVATLLAMSLNHFLKTWIANPRPFVGDGSYAERWAVSAERAADLVTEFSTPSGHAMAGAAFYVTFFACTRSRALRAACVAGLLLTGLSRPYLGVHYLEDVLLGWAIGGALAALAVAHTPRIEAACRALGPGHSLALVLAASAALWLGTRALAGWSAAGQPTAFVAYAGLLAGLVAAYPLETRRVRFDPRSGALAAKAARYALGVALVLGTLVALDAAFALVRDDASPLGDLLRFARYAAAGAVAMLGAPLLFVRAGLARRLRQQEA